MTGVLSHIMSQKAVFFVSVWSAETEASVCLYGVVHLHVFLLEVGRPIPHPESKTWYVCVLHFSLGTFYALSLPFLSLTVRVLYLHMRETLLSVCCCLLPRHPVHRAAHQSCRCDRSHPHCFVVWVWCRQLSLHLHVLFPQVSLAVLLLSGYFSSRIAQLVNLSLEIIIIFGNDIPVFVTHAAIALMLPAWLLSKECNRQRHPGSGEAAAPDYGHDCQQEETVSKNMYVYLFILLIEWIQEIILRLQFVPCVCRIAMTRRQMYQRGEDQNKQTGFWGMIKSVTSPQTGSESILSTYIDYDGIKSLNSRCYQRTMS